MRDLVIDTPQGEVQLRLVKPCTRCSIPDVDPATGEQGRGVAETLASYRSDPRVDGAVTFGMNAVVVSGIDRDAGRRPERPGHAGLLTRPGGRHSGA